MAFRYVKKQPIIVQKQEPSVVDEDELQKIKALQDLAIQAKAGGGEESDIPDDDLVTFCDDAPEEEFIDEFTEEIPGGEKEVIVISSDEVSPEEIKDLVAGMDKPLEAMEKPFEEMAKALPAQPAFDEEFIRQIVRDELREILSEMNEGAGLPRLDPKKPFANTAAN